MDGEETHLQSVSQNKELTRQRIMDAATEVFSEKGYHGAAVDDIVKQSDTSKGSFYFHFPSKQEIFFSLVERFITGLSDSLEVSIEKETGAISKVNVALKTVFESFSKHRSLAKILLVGGVGLGKAFDERLLSIHARFASLIKSHLDDAIAEGSIAPLNTEITSYAWLGAVNEVIIRWLYTGQPKDLDEALENLRKLLLRSVSGEVPSKAFSSVKT